MGSFGRSLFRWVRRLRYPVSLPEEIGRDLGIQVLHSDLNFQECLDTLANQKHFPRNFYRYMPRESAEACFASVLRREKFKNSSLFSYYIHGWLAFELTFDEKHRLRRMYVRHRRLIRTGDRGLEILLSGKKI